MDIGIVFNHLWREKLTTKYCLVNDLVENVFELQLSKRLNQPYFVFGAKNVEFYSPESIYIVFFHYMGHNIFDMRIFKIESNEISYPRCRNGLWNPEFIF